MANESSINQLIKTAGFLGGRELIDKHLTFWTLTMWESDANMRDFRNSSPHRKAMQKLPIWCDEASYIHWIQEEPKLPEWKFISGKMSTEGKISKVRNPSGNQITKNYAEIKWTKLERTLKLILK